MQSALLALGTSPILVHFGTRFWSPGAQAPGVKAAREKLMLVADGICRSLRQPAAAEFCNGVQQMAHVLPRGTHTGPVFGGDIDLPSSNWCTNFN